MRLAFNIGGAVVHGASTFLDLTSGDQKLDDAIDRLIEQ